MTLVIPVTSNNTFRLTMYVQRNWWWLLVTWGNSAKWAASVCFMEYLTTYVLNAMEIVQSNFFLGYMCVCVCVCVLYEDPTRSLVEQRKEANFTCHIMYLAAFWHFCTSPYFWHVPYCWVYESHNSCSFLSHTP